MTVGARPASGTEGLRRQNTAAVLRALRENGPSTRSELAQHTGLAKATVGVIIGGLEEAGAVLEGGARPGVRGRPGRAVGLSGAGFVGLGLELNVDYVSAVAVDLAGRILAEEIRPADAPDALSSLAAWSVAQVTTRSGTIIGTTLAVPALVRGDDRTVAWTPNLHLERDGLGGSGLAERLAGLVPGGDVQVSNDANCAAYAEAHHGAARGVRNALYLTGTVGVGAGILHNGELMRGGAGFAGEVGHVPVGDSTAPCGCGRTGCWEASVGLHAMLARVGMPELDTPLGTAEAVAARAHDPAVRTGLERVGVDLGLGIAMLSNILDPEVVVLGGYFVPLGDLVLAAARRTLDERLASPAQVRPELRLSTLGIRAAALGAAEQSLGPVFAGERDLSAT